MKQASPHRAPRAGQAGITLIEMMVVLVVIGVATGVATLSLGALARDDATEQEARRLATAIAFAVDDALISGSTQIVAWDAEGYQIGSADRHELTRGVTLARGDGTDAAIALSANATTPAVDLLVQGDAVLWRVSFDGLSASVLQGAAP